MRELRIGKKILEKRRVYNLGGREMGCTRRPERNCRFTFSVVSGRDMVPAIFGLHNEQCSP